MALRILRIRCGCLLSVTLAVRVLFLILLQHSYGDVIQECMSVTAYNDLSGLVLLLLPLQPFLPLQPPLPLPLLVLIAAKAKLSQEVNPTSNYLLGFHIFYDRLSISLSLHLSVRLCLCLRHSTRARNRQPT